MKFNILHYVLLLYSPVSTTLRPLISFLPEAHPIFYPRPSRQHVQFSLYVHLHSVFFASHLQYEVHDMPADQQLQLALEHGGTDLHPQATSSWEQQLCHKQVRECPLLFFIQTWKG